MHHLLQMCELILQTAQKTCVLYGHTRPVACMLLLAPSSEGFEDHMLVTGSSDKQIKVNTVEGSHKHGVVMCDGFC